MASIYDNFKMITLESSFVVRTFFFVIFGFTILLATLLDLKVWMVSLLILGILYGIRYAYFRFIIRRDIMPEVWMAPRGLITILLYYSIPEVLVVPGFNPGILLLVILVSSILMAVSLIRFRTGASKLPEGESAGMEAGITHGDTLDEGEVPLEIENGSEDHKPFTPPEDRGPAGPPRNAPPTETGEQSFDG